MQNTNFYPVYHSSRVSCWHTSDIPSSLRPYIGYSFESSSERTEEFKSFDRKYKNAIKKKLPKGWSIYAWRQNHFESSATLRTPDGRFVFLSYSDVRYDANGWMTHILVREMEHDRDWRGGRNRYTDLVNLTEDLEKLTA